ncbi:MAG: FG-GAP-like repeat-containing protein [Myxococcota bacterium]|nr:FG-GAP-like repeat-containing protein [Myxococcota bacterium]
MSVSIATSVSAQSRDQLVQPPRFTAPTRGAVVGNLGGKRFGAEELARGAYSLALPLDLPSDRAPLLAGVTPSYSPDHGLSEWGMGFRNDLAIRRTALVGEVDYASDEHASPWGRLARGSDGAYYVSGLHSRVRITRSGAGTTTTWTAIDADGTRFEFSTRVVTAHGVYAWYLTRVTDTLGAQTNLTYVWQGGANASQPYLSSVTWGPAGATDTYRARVDYVNLTTPFPRYEGRHRFVLDRRVDRVHVEARVAGGGYGLRHRHVLTHRLGTTTRVPYLERVQKEYASGQTDPATEYTYDFGDQTLLDSRFREIPALSAHLRTEVQGGNLIQPDRSAALDQDEDGRIDLERAADQTLLMANGSSWSSRALSPNPTANAFCRFPTNVANPPRMLVPLHPRLEEHQVLAMNASASATTAYVCDREGVQLASQSLGGANGGNWRLGANTRLVDVDRDQRPDLVRLVGSTLQILRNESTEALPRFASTPTAQNLRLNNLAFSASTSWFRDVNGDGVVDLVVRLSSGSLATWLGVGGGVFETNGAGTQFFDFNGNAVSLAPPPPPAPPPAIYFVDLNHDGLVDVLEATSSSIRVFTNRNAGTFRQVQVPGLGLRPAGANVSSPVPLDLRGEGGTEIVLTSGSGQLVVAHGLELDRPSTGLLAEVHDGRGSRVAFEYAWMAPEPGIASRQTVLAATTHRSYGVDDLRITYTYESPVAHSVGRFLVGFGAVTERGPLLTRRAEFLHDDDTWGVLVGDERVDVRTPGLVRFTRHDHVSSTFRGVPWVRRRSSTSGWRDAVTGVELATTSEITAYDRDVCPVETRTTLPGGTLIRRETLTPTTALPGLSGALTCLGAEVTYEGRHTDASLDFTETVATERNGIGQTTRVRQLGPAGASTLQEIVYDARGRLEVARAPGRGEVRVAYDAATGLPTTLTDPDGVIHRLGRDTLRDLTTSLVDERDPTLRYEQYFQFDGRERLDRAWRNGYSLSASSPLVQYLYVDAGLARLGATVQSTHVRTRDTLAGGSVAWAETLSIVAADGSEIAQARAVGPEWSIGMLTEHRRVDSSTATFAHGQPASLNLFALTIPMLHAGRGAMLSESRTTGLGAAHTDRRTCAAGATGSSSTQRAIVGASFVETRQENANGTRTSRRALDAGERPVWVEDASGARTSFVHDVLGRVRRVSLADGTRHDVDFDAYGRTAEVRRAGVGRIEHEHDPVTGLATHRRVYDTDDALVHESTSTYDAIGRLIEIEDVSADGDRASFVHTYDGAGLSDRAQRGRLTRVRGRDYAREQVFDVDGRVRRETTNVGPWTVEVTNVYHPNGEPRSSTRVIREHGTEVERSTRELFYDKNGRLVEVELDGRPFYTLHYDALGRVERATFAAGLGSAGGTGGSVELEVSFDAVTLGRRGLTLTHADGRRSGTTWQLDARGLIAHELVEADRDVEDHVYRYDDRGFLVEHDGRQALERWSYDPVGMLTDVDDLAGARPIVRRERSIQLGADTYELDAAGRVTKRRGSQPIELRYGAFGLLVGATTARDSIELRYDEQGRRVLKLRNGQPDAAYVAGGHLSSRGFVEPVRVAGQLVGVLRRGRFETVEADARGTVIADAYGRAAASPFGMRTRDPELADALDFVEHGRDRDLGLVRMGVRDYDPRLGSFTTPDPLYLADPARCVESQVDCNLYAYAANNPVSFVDPSGLEPELASAIVTVVVDRNFNFTVHEVATKDPGYRNMRALSMISQADVVQMARESIFRADILYGKGGQSVHPDASHAAAVTFGSQGAANTFASNELFVIRLEGKFPVGNNGLTSHRTEWNVTTPMGSLGSEGAALNLGVGPLSLGGKYTPKEGGGSSVLNLAFGPLSFELKKDRSTKLPSPELNRLWNGSAASFGPDAGTDPTGARAAQFWATVGRRTDLAVSPTNVPSTVTVTGRPLPPGGSP